MANLDGVALQPFRMHANLYFVGSEKVSVHLLDTSEGLVLIDTGYPEMHDLILENIRAMGFAPEKLRAIFHTHGHIDHYGNTRELVALSGATTYISRIDNAIVDGTLDLSWAKELHLEPIPPFSCDVLMEDGQVFRFGDTEIRCVLTPGHTDGVMSFFITLKDGTVAGMQGGAGMNSMKAAFLRAYGLSFDCRTRFKESLVRLAEEQVDLMLGNHPNQNDTASKMQRILAGESDVLDREEWQRYLKALDRRIDKLMATDL